MERKLSAVTIQDRLPLALAVLSRALFLALCLVELPIFPVVATCCVHSARCRLVKVKLDVLESLNVSMLVHVTLSLSAVSYWLRTARSRHG
jgi:hypothetical protein